MIPKARQVLLDILAWTAGGIIGIIVLLFVITLIFGI